MSQWHKLIHRTAGQYYIPGPPEESETMKLIDTFVPPGVQRQLWEQTGQAQRAMPREARDKIMALWQRRNTCAEEEVEAIDAEMLAIALATGKE